MPNIKSAKKRVKVAAKKRLLNRTVKAGVKSHSKKFEAVIASQDKTAIITESRVLTSTIDKASAKGVMHKNKANRLKARIAKRADSVAQ